MSAWMRRLVCAFVVRKPPKTGFSRVKAHIISYSFGSVLTKFNKEESFRSPSFIS